MIKVILDTNFLVYCAKQKIDYAEQISELTKGGAELATTAQVVEELEKLKTSSRKYSDRNAAALALKLLGVNQVEVLKVGGRNADNSIMIAGRGNIIATHDRGLARKISAAIVIKGKKTLALR